MLSVGPSWVVEEWQLQHFQRLSLKHTSGRASLRDSTRNRGPQGGKQTVSQRGTDHQDPSYIGALPKPHTLVNSWVLPQSWETTPLYPFHRGNNRLLEISSSVPKDLGSSLEGGRKGRSRNILIKARVGQ